MSECVICHREADEISQALGLCAGCILADTPEARAQAAAVHAHSRAQFDLPPAPPQAPDGIKCQRCVNACTIGEGQVGYCGVRGPEAGRLRGGDADAAAVSWYHDPLPTNCVAAWECPASGAGGFPEFTDTKGPEQGFANLAVFYEACSFDCLFCQNWHFKSHRRSGPRRSAAKLAGAVTPQTRCICFFGGDPSCQIDHALAAVELARSQKYGRFLRICWETNGAVSRAALVKMGEVSLESGGCIKFDLKAWDEPLHRALCGATNRRTLENFEYLAGWISERTDPPFLVASTLLVPGYVETEQVRRIARFIARLDKTIPYALLAFHPDFEMADLPTTTRQLAGECFSAAEGAGLTHVRLGNRHLLT